MPAVSIAHDAGVAGASVCLMAPDGRILFLLRTDGFWDLPGGHAEEGESPEQTAERETREETGAWPYGELTLLDHNQEDGADFSMFRRDVRHAFTPKLDDEHDGFRWATFEDRPEGMVSEANDALTRAFELNAEDEGLNESERAEADRDHKERNEMPASAFLEGKGRKYPIKVKRDGQWVYDKHLLIAAASEARMHDHKELADEADSIRRREFGDDEPEGRASDCLAFDRASVRSIDQDGRLHVETTHISKANVCPYRGDEIPDYESLGLDPDHVYMLYRAPEELEKAAPTSNNIPVLSEHVAVNAQDHRPELIIGATGSDASFESPYLDNSLVVWVKDAIDKIDDKRQQEISCSYYYTADMTPGTHDGIAYDGVMRDIVFNHVAVVTQGRAGPDVAVGDSLSNLTGETTMGKKSLSMKAAMAKGALLAVLKPKKLAADAALDLNAILADVTTKNWLTKKPGIVSAIKSKLARDADIEDVVKLIDALDGEKPDDDEDDENPVVVQDEDPVTEKVMDLLRGKVSDEDMQAVCDLIKSDRANDEPDQTEGAANAHPGEEDDPHAMDETDEERDAREKKEREDRERAVKANDAALGARIRRETMQQFRDIAAAEEEVRPYVGKLAAMDSANDVYKAALEIMGVEVKGVHPSAYRAILQAHGKPSESRRTASDSAPLPDMAEAFPNSARLR